MSTPDAIHFLGEALQAEQALHAYILIDPLWGDPMDREMVELEGCTIHPISLKRAAVPDFGEDTWPYLIAWRPQAVSTLHQSIDVAKREQAEPAREDDKGFAIGGWLLSQQAPEAIVRHMQAMFLVLSENRGHRFARWSDRSLFDWMWPVLDDPQRAQLMGPIVTWWTLDRYGQIISHPHPDVDSGQTLRVPLKLRADQWQRYRSHYFASQIISGFVRAQPETPANYNDTCAALLGRARELQLTSMPDLSILGAYAALVHPRFADHPKVVNAMDRAHHDQRSLVGALASLADPEDWDAVRHDLIHGTLHAQGVAP